MTHVALSARCCCAGLSASYACEPEANSVSEPGGPGTTPADSVLHVWRPAVFVQVADATYVGKAGQPDVAAAEERLALGKRRGLRGLCGHVRLRFRLQRPGGAAAQATGEPHEARRVALQPRLATDDDQPAVADGSRPQLGDQRRLVRSSGSGEVQSEHLGAEDPALQRHHGERRRRHPA
jgi:hypothetical protein